MPSKAAIDRFEETFRGRLIQPREADYDEARAVWNGMIDRRPAFVARCTGSADVIACIDFARTNDMPITVRGGGHGVAGRSICDDGVLIDLSPMRNVRVDAKRKTARVGGGATWGVVDHETQRFGLAVTGGVDSRTGVAGLTLGGGIGYLARPYGLTIDNLQSAEVVLSDGRVVTASAREHPDLYWGLRGGGGGLGVVTSFEYQLHEVGPEIMTAQVFHPPEAAAEAMAFYRDFALGAADEVACYALFVNVPPVEPFPEEHQGRTALAIVASHAGSLEEGEAALRPLGAYGAPMLTATAPMPYTTLQSSFDAGAPDGGRFYWKAHTLDSITDDLISAVVDRVDRLPGPYSNVFFEPLGGTISRVEPSATAFPHRRAAFGFGISSGWADPAADEAAMEWTRALYDAVTPHASGGVYLNYLDRDEDARLGDAYGANLDRVQQIKRTYDPDHVFAATAREVPAKSYDRRERRTG
jgi:FAD/FMN-containing dehydrogenase